DTTATGSKTLTSATFYFESWMVGYNITITAGTNFTLGAYAITAFTNATTVTLASSPTPSAAGSAGVGDLGRTIPTFTDKDAVSRNIIWENGRTSLRKFRRRRRDQVPNRIRATYVKVSPQIDYQVNGSFVSGVTTV